MNFKKKDPFKLDFSRIKISLASPESILARSNGEISLPDTINHRDLKPVPKGLFSQHVYGPVNDYECACGKYKGKKYLLTVCEKCGVEVNSSKIRRESMGHIKLAVPVVPIFYYRGQPNILAHLLGAPAKKVEKLVSYSCYAVIKPGIFRDELEVGQICTPEEYMDWLQRVPEKNSTLSEEDPDKVIFQTGGLAAQTLLRNLDLDALSAELRTQIATATSQQKRSEAIKRLTYIEAFRKKEGGIENRPEYIAMQVLPVISPELRPLMQLPNSRFAMSDLTDLYRRIIIRNNRLKEFMDIDAPPIILRNEMRLLQEAVDALFDNSKKSPSMTSSAGRPYKSFSDDLKGKKGLFRNNLLGKRTDYSGRSVIVVGPSLKLNECGLPKQMAVELFKPFIIKGLIYRKIAKNIKDAKRIIERKDPVIWDILEKQMKGHPILLNRPPTLHRLSIQAFFPKLIEGKAIQLHPLVCAGFNADFDGDQMAVHVPLGQEAIAEATLLMTPVNNILKPASGEPIITPSREITLGLYYLTKIRQATAAAPLEGAGTLFYGIEEVVMAHNHKRIALHTPIRLRLPSARLAKGDQSPAAEKAPYAVIETTVGRALLNVHIPDEIPYVNELLTNKNIQRLVSTAYVTIGPDRTAKLLDDLKDLGFKHAYRGGLSINIDDITVPESKPAIIASAEKEVNEVKKNYQMGFITNTERYNQVIDIWTKANILITNQLIKKLEKDQGGFNNIYMMMHSGARGSKQQIKQGGASRGLITKPQANQNMNQVGSILEDPIRENFKEGLGLSSYFKSSRGTRKGLADTSLKTADTGYLCRKLANLGQEVIITEKKCNTLIGFKVSVHYHIVGRAPLEDVIDPETGACIVPKDQFITQAQADRIRASEIDQIEIRSPLTCQTIHGICETCYGISQTNLKPSQVGDTVGIRAAQSISEPGTQLTLRTFHVGGAATYSTVESTIKASHTGEVQLDNLEVLDKKIGDRLVQLVISKTAELSIVNKTTNKEVASYHIPYGAHLLVSTGQTISKGEDLYEWDPYNLVIMNAKAGTLRFEGMVKDITYKEKFDENTGYKQRITIPSKDKKLSPTIILEQAEGKETVYNIPSGARILVEDKQAVEAGSLLCKIPRIAHKRGDITGGLPFVTELFEVRNPSNAGVASDFDGVVHYGAIKRGNREIIVTAKDGTTKKYMIPLSKYILVQDGDYVRCGTLLSEGVTSIPDLLRIKGPSEAIKYIITQLQGVYTMQGVHINSKHIEVIIRAMMKSVEIVKPGDTLFVPTQIVHKYEFDQTNQELFDKEVVVTAGDSRYKVGQILSKSEVEEAVKLLEKDGKNLLTVRPARPATAQPKIQGITRSSIRSDSFISAASFQETNKVLTQAALFGKVDHLRGLKENVIMGRLIPAGTGMSQYKRLRVLSEENYTEIAAGK